MASRYLVTIHDRIQKFCTSCAQMRFIYVEKKDDGEKVTCCCHCSYILKRDK